MEITGDNDRCHERLRGSLTMIAILFSISSKSHERIKRGREWRRERVREKEREEGGKS